MRIENLGMHSWHDYTSKVANTHRLAGANDNSSTQSERFTGTSSMSEALRLARDGWQQGANEIAQTLDKLPAAIEVLPDWQLDVAGSICNVPGFIAGEPECMWAMSSYRRTESRMVLAVPGGYPGHIPADSAMNYAKAIAAIVRGLEASGINPAVYSIDTNSAHGTQFIWGVVVRDFGEPLDLAKIAFAYHPSFLRRIVFGWMERTAATIRATHASYGHAEDLTNALLNTLLPELPAMSVILPELYNCPLHDVDATIAKLRITIESALLPTYSSECAGPRDGPYLMEDLCTTTTMTNGLPAYSAGCLYYC